jgi:hypothetical protein
MYLVTLDIYVESILPCFRAHVSTVRLLSISDLMKIWSTVLGFFLTKAVDRTDVIGALQEAYKSSTEALTTRKKDERRSDVRWTTRGPWSTGRSSISCHSLQSPLTEVNLNKASCPAVLPIFWCLFPKPKCKK